MTRHRFFATTARGLEPVLLDEIRALHPLSAKASHGGVSFEGTLETAYRANLWLRTAQRVLLPLIEFPCPDYEALYEGAKSIPWQEHLRPGGTLAVEAACFRSPLSHSHHAALRIKDAIVDLARERTGSRPDVDVKDPDLRVHAYIHGEQCQLSIDLSGEALFMRRYRVRQTAAPLKETLAAAVLLISGWDRRAPLVDPLCGSGTLVIEAAMLARDRAPGRHRSFGFQRHPSYDQAAAAVFRRMIEEADARLLPPDVVRLAASDRDPEVVEAAKANLRAAGMAESIAFAVRDVRDLPPVDPGTYIVSNPPYGERLGGPSASVQSLYRGMGYHFKTFPPCHVWMLSSSPGFEAAFGMPPRARHRLFNGPIETWLYGYRLGGRPARR
jgi:putative N6-adenine-specific DNA methylase